MNLHERNVVCAEFKYETRKIVMNVGQCNLHKLESLGSEAFTIERTGESVEKMDEKKMLSKELTGEIEQTRESVEKMDEKKMLSKELTGEIEQTRESVEKMDEKKMLSKELTGEIEQTRESVEKMDEKKMLSKELTGEIEQTRESVEKIDEMLSNELTGETDEINHKAPVMCHCAQCMCKIPIVGSILKCICFGVCVNKYYVGWFRDCTDPRFWIRYFFMKVMELSLTLYNFITFESHYDHTISHSEDRKRAAFILYIGSLVVGTLSFVCIRSLFRSAIQSEFGRNVYDDIVRVVTCGMCHEEKKSASKNVVTEKKREEETKTIDTVVSISSITPETPHETLRKLKYELKMWEIEKQKQYDQDETFRKKMNAVHFNRSHFVSWLTRTSDEALLFIKAKSMKWKNLKDKEKYEEKIRFNETELAYKHLQHGVAGRFVVYVILQFLGDIMVK
eukprot:g3006.t1